MNILVGLIWLIWGWSDWSVFSNLNVGVQHLPNPTHPHLPPHPDGVGVPNELNELEKTLAFTAVHQRVTWIYQNKTEQ